MNECFCVASTNLAITYLNIPFYQRYSNIEHFYCPTTFHSIKQYRNNEKKEYVAKTIVTKNIFNRVSYNNIGLYCSIPEKWGWFKRENMEYDVIIPVFVEIKLGKTILVSTYSGEEGEMCNYYVENRETNTVEVQKWCLERCDLHTKLLYKLMEEQE